MRHCFVSCVPPSSSWTGSNSQAFTPNVALFFFVSCVPPSPISYAQLRLHTLFPAVRPGPSRQAQPDTRRHIGPHPGYHHLRAHLCTQENQIDIFTRAFEIYSAHMWLEAKSVINLENENKLPLDKQQDRGSIPRSTL